MDKRNVDIVLARMDKIGDLVVSLPVDEHPVFQGARVHWFISKGLGFLTAQSAPQRSSSEYQRKFSFSEFSRMVKWLKENRPRTIVLMHTPWWVSLAAWWAGVPERMGRLSQWHSFLFLNLGIRQKRSDSDRHESDFNFDLVEGAFNRLGVRHSDNLPQIKNTYLRLVAPNPLATISNRGLSSHGYRVVHPGMFGSALNWPANKYLRLVEKLAEETPVVITGTKADTKYLEQLQGLRSMLNVKWMVDELKISELLDILSQARSVIAPSTGVLHLAASLGTPALGIYSPRKVEHPLRWGPRGPRVAYLVPQVKDREEFPPEVMNEITVDQVLSKIAELERGQSDSTHAHPEFEARVLAALRERGVDLEEPRELAAMVKKLSDYYVENPGAPSPWDQSFAIAAYLAYFQVLNFVRLRSVWREVNRFLPESAFREIWDFGSGLGATQWVLESEALAPRALYCVESSKRAAELHRELATGTKWSPEFPSRALPGPHALGVFSYSFLEMQEALPPLEKFEHLLIVEPSTREAGRDLMQWRAKLKAQGFQALAPCTHNGDCPLLVHSQRDWCHMRVHFTAPEWFERLESFLPMKNRTLTYSYLLMSRTAQPTANGARVIGDTLPERGKTKQMICRGPKREFVSWLHRFGEPPQIPHGSLVSGIENCEEKGGELRAALDTLTWQD